MKNFPHLIKAFGALTLVVLAAGCMTNTQFKASELTQSGFKTISATSPAQQAKLKALSATKVTQVQRGGKTYYVFPDLKNNILYVGQQPQYLAYKQLKAAKQQEINFQMDSENAFISNDAGLTDSSDWGSWEGMDWGY